MNRHYQILYCLWTVVIICKARIKAMKRNLWRKNCFTKWILTNFAYVANGKKLFFYSATIHWAEICDAVWCCVMTSSFPSTIISLTLDGVMFLRVINVRNTCKSLCYSQTFGRISSVQWWKIGRIWRIQLLFHRFLCVRIQIDQL